MGSHWHDAMVIGLGVLNFAPDQFWRMTVPEFIAALEGYLLSIGYHQDKFFPSLSRKELVAMQQRFPDQPFFSRK